MMNNKGKRPYGVNAYQSIKDLILESKILPGEAITEEALANRLNLGRTPIREALKRLEQEGLIVTQNRRKRVYTLGIEEINQIFELKICIEGQMAAYAAERATDQELANIQKIMQKMEKHASLIPQDNDSQVTDDWFQEWMNLDAALHGQIYLAAANPRAWKIIQGFNTKIHRFKIGMLTLKGRVEISVAEHRRFVDAILAREAQAAQEAMRKHLANVHQELVKLMKIFTVRS